MKKNNEKKRNERKRIHIKKQKWEGRGGIKKLIIAKRIKK